MSDGFLGRWSRRKLDAKEGKALEPEPVVAPATRAEASPVATPGEPDAATPAAPTLDEAKALTPESDFARFAAADVAPEVKNAALKKLFADPRYNIMDGMDVYIDDYSKPDPIPPAMLRQLASAKFLGLFDEEEKQEAAQRARDDADNPIGETVAQCEPPPPAQAEPEPTHHADPDLRLQQNHASAGEDPGRGTQ